MIFVCCVCCIYFIRREKKNFFNREGEEKETREKEYILLFNRVALIYVSILMIIYVSADVMLRKMGSNFPKQEKRYFLMYFLSIFPVLFMVEWNQRTKKRREIEERELEELKGFSYLQKKRRIQGKETLPFFVALFIVFSIVWITAGEEFSGGRERYNIKIESNVITAENAEELMEEYINNQEINKIVANLQEQTKEADKSTEELLKEEIGETKQISDILEVEEEKEEDILSEGFFQEKAARRIFEEYLEKEGFAFEIRYNAKGFFYIDLEYRPAGEPQDKSQTGFYGHKLLYDRPSKNGKCEIFVLQRSHYTEDGIEESAVIVDMYAVETTTGQVVAGNKQNWGDPGTEEYRQITGE